MFSLIGMAMTVIAGSFLAIVLFFALEVVGGLFRNAKTFSRVARKPLTVLIPAHNEGDGVVPTIRDVIEQLSNDDRVVVVADNCDDDTADHARAAGAVVVERHDLDHRGKGYALQFGVDHLNSSPPETVVIVDADCRLGAGCLSALAATTENTGQPTQALYLMKAGVGSPPQRRVSEFAWLLINQVRMGGLFNIFGVTRLTGSGMALPWSVIESLPLGTGNIVEDLALTVDLTKAGAAPTLCSAALVTSQFPNADEAAVIQRARWEHGAMGVARSNILSLFVATLKNMDLRAAALAMDLAIPPLSILLVGLLSTLVVSAVFSLFGQPMPFYISIAALVVFTFSIAVAWFFCGREVLPFNSFGNIAKFLLSKTRVYQDNARATTKSWTRTERGPGDSNNS